MPRVVHFEIHADNPERAAAFYTTVFGWTITPWEGAQEYWLIQTGPEEQPGINGGLVRRMSPAAADAILAYVCTIDVPSLDDFLAKVTANGGTLALEKMPVPGVGWLAYCRDPEGNVFGMMQTDATAGAPASAEAGA